MNDNPNMSGDASELRRHAEVRLHQQRKNAGLERTDVDALKLIQELQVHQIELELQNEELQLARNRAESLFQKYIDLYDFAPIGYLTLDRDGIIHEANLAASSLLGLDRTQLIKRRFSLCVCDIDLPLFKVFLAKIFEKKLKESCEITLTRQDKTVFHARIGAMITVSGEECRATLEDITERKRLEHQLRQARKMEAVGHLAGGMAHEFNNILAAMMMSVDLAKMQTAEAQTKEMLANLEFLIQREAELIKQLVAYAGKSIMWIQPIDWASFISEKLPRLKNLIGEQITLNFSSPKNLPKVNADKSKLEQVLTNLCLNAKEAMKNGGVLKLLLHEQKVNAQQMSAHSHCREGNYICLSIIDNGCGMDEKKLERLFEPFFSTKNVCHGTGLGLASVYGIVQQQGGWIEVESAIGKGSTFRIYLPAVAHITEGQSAVDSQPLVFGSGTILLVEDNNNLRRTTRNLLEKLGYEVLEVEDAQHALNIWQEYHEKIDLLYTDMVMPGNINGLQLAQQLVASKPSLKVIVTSGYSLEINELSDVLKSSVHFLSKPCLLSALTSKIHECLSKVGNMKNNRVP